MDALISLLKLPVQRRLLLASLPADFADWLDYVAIIAVIVYAWGHGPLALAALSVTLALPYVLIGPLLAAWVDRTQIKRVLLLSNLGRGVLTLCLVVVPNLELLLVVVFLRAAVDSAFTPAKQAAIQLATPEPLMMAANGLHQGVNQTSKILGPALGGLLIAVMPAQGVFLINAVLSLVAFIVLMGLQLPERTIAADARESFWKRLTGGVAEMMGNRKLVTVLVFAASAHFVWFLYDTQLAFLNGVFGYDATVFGIAIAASGAGGVVGAVLAGSVRSMRPLLMMALPAMLSGTVTVMLALAAFWEWNVPLSVYLPIFAVLGGTTVFMLVPYRAVIQIETPPDRIARVSAAGEAVMIVAMMAAPFIGSLIALGWGIPAPFLVGGVLLGVLGLAGLTLAFRQ